MEKAAGFYKDVMGFKLTVDQGWAKVYKVTVGAHIGFVDKRRGYHRASPTKPVMVTLVMSDVDGWYRYLRQKGVETLIEPHVVVLEEPEGYIIEK